MKTIENLEQLSAAELTSINGGGFAYDLGFGLRMIALGGNFGGGGQIAVEIWMRYVK